MQGATIFKVNQKDFDKIRELIKTELPDVEIVYVTTGPSACILRVTKSMPFEIQDSSTQTFYRAIVADFPTNDMRSIFLTLGHSNTGAR